jgi:predicted metal-binding protein
VKLHVCTLCSLGRAGFADTLRAQMPAGVEVVEVACMSGCTHDQTVAFRAPAKTAYLFGDITLADLADLQNFARLYAASSEPGIFTEPRFWLRGWAFPLSEPARSAGWGRR